MTTSLQPDNTEQHGDLAGLRTASATRLQSAERDAGTSLLVQMLGLEIVLTELAAARIEIGRRAGDIATAGRTLQQIAAAVTGRIETVIAKAEGRQRTDRVGQGLDLALLLGTPSGTPEALNAELLELAGPPNERKRDRLRRPRAAQQETP